MSTDQGQIGDAAEAWKAVRADPAIQFAPIEAPPPSKPPGWLDALFKWLAELLAPVGEAVGLSWPVFKWVLLAGGIAAILLIVWRVFGDSLRLRFAGDGAEIDTSWAPEQGEALVLLDEADRLAAEGRYDEATHLLLQRSVGQIAAARPDWVDPATTARELAAFEPLPAAARHAFATIAERVERSLFALRTLGEDDWHAARAAYADFALQRLRA